MLNLDEVFPRKKAQKEVAELLLRKGIRVSEDRRFYFGEIEVASAAIARVLGVDRRVVAATAGAINADPKLMSIFSKLNTTLLLRDVASELHFGAIEFIPKDPAAKGLIASVAKVIADAGISVRQITTDDPMFKGAGMTIVTERPLPGDIVDKIVRLPGVEKVSVIS